MSTAKYKLSGVTKWAKVRTPDEKYDNYQVPLYMTDESWEEYRKSGCRLKEYEDEDGKFVVFKRKHVEFNYAKKEQVTNGPPKVARLTDGEYKDFDGLIGNGSEISVWIDVYDTRNGPGHRLIGVGVDNLVEYNPDGKSGTSEIKMPF